MKKILFSIFLLFFSQMAYPSDPYYSLSKPSYPGQSTPFSSTGTLSSVCSAYAAWLTASETAYYGRSISVSLLSITGNLCDLRFQDGGNVGYASESVAGPLCDGGVYSGGLCVDDCPTGKFHPPLSGGGVSSTCVTDGAPSCSAVGVDTSAIVPLCREAVSGSPAVCYDSDYVDFPLSGCPDIDCGGGLIVKYPASCPDVKTCPPDFNLSPLGDGLGSTCVKPAPDEQTAPCVFVGTSKICAADQYNCVLSGGQFTCLQEKQVQPPGSTCYTVNAKLYCLSNQPEIKTTQTTTTNPDGSVTVKETTQPTVQGSSSQTTTTITAPNGTKTTTSSNASDVNKFLSYEQQQAQKLDLSKVELNTANTAQNTKNISDKLNDFMGGFNTISNESYDSSGVSAAKASDESALQSFVGGSNPFQAYYDNHGFYSVIAPYLPDAANRSCAGSIHVPILAHFLPGMHEFNFDPCVRLLPLREILAWFFSILTAWQCINIATRTLTR